MAAESTAGARKLLEEFVAGSSGRSEMNGTRRDKHCDRKFQRLLAANLRRGREHFTARIGGLPPPPRGAEQLSV
jgi:hypothetical protein